MLGDLLRGASREDLDGGHGCRVEVGREEGAGEGGVDGEGAGAADGGEDGVHLAAGGVGRLEVVGDVGVEAERGEGAGEEDDEGVMGQDAGVGGAAAELVVGVGRGVGEGVGARGGGGGGDGLAARVAGGEAEEGNRGVRQAGAVGDPKGEVRVDEEGGRVDALSGEEGARGRGGR